MNSFMGLKVIVSEHAIQRRPLFPDKPATKRRRRRVMGKFGCWEKDFPAAFMIAGGLLVHPKVEAALRKQSQDLAAQVFLRGDGSPQPRGLLSRFGALKSSQGVGA